MGEGAEAAGDSEGLLRMKSTNVSDVTDGEMCRSGACSSDMVWRRIWTCMSSMELPTKDPWSKQLVEAMLECVDVDLSELVRMTESTSAAKDTSSSIEPPMEDPFQRGKNVDLSELVRMAESTSTAKDTSPSMEPPMGDPLRREPVEAMLVCVDVVLSEVVPRRESTSSSKGVLSLEDGSVWDGG